MRKNTVDGVPKFLLSSIGSQTSNSAPAFSNIPYETCHVHGCACKHTSIRSLFANGNRQNKRGAKRLTFAEPMQVSYPVSEWWKTLTKNPFLSMGNRKVCRIWSVGCLINAQCQNGSIQTSRDLAQATHLLPCWTQVVFDHLRIHMFRQSVMCHAPDCHHPRFSEDMFWGNALLTVVAKSDPPP
jgi:hypothetical protein